MIQINFKNDVSYKPLRTHDFTSNGGNKVFVSTNKDEFENFFNVKIIETSDGEKRLDHPIKCLIDKEYLLNYMYGISFEYKFHLLQKYKSATKVTFDYWLMKLKEIKKYENLEFQIRDITIRNQGQIYIQGNDGSPFESCIWQIAIPNISKLTVEQSIISEEYKYIFRLQLKFNPDLLNNKKTEEYEISENKAKNIIYYGAPGTGKSYAVNLITDEASKKNRVEKITFYPDYDYHSFVGNYKPVMKNEKIQYSFIPQSFIRIYIKAWKDLKNKYYLQIEEINRGNCSEIFGDIFQLLDRNSDYEISIDEDLKQYLEENLGKNHPGIKNGKMRLPNNLDIIATMNTSDQSLFPMDSAFKRRWEWIYVPIKYEYNCEDSSKNYVIKIKNKTYKWLEFLKIINEKIYEATESQDKQIGNWFVRPNVDNIIDEYTFISKVIFYLWNDIFKDEDEFNIFRISDELLSQISISGNLKVITFEKFFEDMDTNNSELLIYLMEGVLKLKAIDKGNLSN